MMRRRPGTAGERRVLGDAHGRRTMIWIMAIMVLLTVLAAALGLATARAGRTLDRQLAGRLTAQVVEGDAVARDAAVARIRSALAASTDVAGAAEVDRERLSALLEPWLGEAGLDADLPMPAMIDIDLRRGDDAAVARVTALVRDVAPAARIDRHATWLGPVRSFIATLGWTALGIVVVMATATATVVLLGARAGLDTHRGTIDILHMLGSTDVQIARLFQRRIAVDTLAGGLAGAVVGIAVVLFLGIRLDALGSELLGGVTLGWEDWLLVAIVPFAFTLLAAIAARIVVLRTLARVL